MHAPPEREARPRPREPAAAPGAGRALEPEVRGRMESAFARPLGHVRIHDDGAAAGAAASLGARAFAVGDHVVFGAGRYRPGTRAGDTLLAHELAHTLQARAAPAAALLSGRHDPAEREARRAAATVAAGGTPTLTSARSALVHRDDGEDPGFELVGPPAPPGLVPTGETIVVLGVELADDPPYVRNQLEAVYASGGAEAVEELVEAVAGRIEEERSGTVTSAGNEAVKHELTQHGPGEAGLPVGAEEIAAGDERIALLERIASVTRDQWAALQKDNEAFLKQFQGTAEQIVTLLLDESEREVQAERERYGIETTVEFEETFRGGKEGFDRKVTHTMAANPETEALGVVAADLARRLRRLEELQSEQRSLVRISSRKVNAEEWESEEVISDPEAHARLGEQIEVAQREYDEARAAAEMQFPILSRYLEEGEAGDLETIGAGPGAGAAALLAEESGEKLRNIKTVRDNLGGRFSVWKQPAIVDLTKLQLGVEAGSAQERAVAENVARIESEEFWINLGLAVIGIALALIAAIPTGGASIGVAVAVGAAEAGGLALTIYSLQETVRRYQLESAAAGTHFQKARAISQEEPSLFWVALELVTAGVSVASAASKFAQVAKAFRAAAAATPAAGAADETLAALREAAEAAGPGVAERLAEDVLARRAAREAVREALSASGDEIAEGAGGAVAKARQLIRELVEAVRGWARRVFSKFGFKSYDVKWEGDAIAVYGIRSYILIAYIDVGSVEEWIVHNTPEILSLRHSRASQLGAARAAAASGDTLLAHLLRGNAVQISEELGEIAADAVVRTKFGVGAPIFQGRGPGVFDLVYESGGTVFIVEAKGGAGRLGTRIVGPGVSAQQGSIAYVRSILKQMTRPGATQEQLDAAAKIEAALAGGKLKYVLAETRRLGGTAPLETKLSDFPLYDPDLGW